MLAVSFILLLQLFYNRYQGITEKITFQRDIEFEGLISLPETPGPYPAILLLHGSGGSHQQYDKAYFRFHANAFVDKGFAVMVYTKRGSGDNDVDYKYTSYHDLKDDALAAINYLKSRGDIDSSNIGLMGASESGWFTPQLAQETNIRFVINRVSSPFDVRKTILHEIRSDAKSEGYSDEEIESTIVPMTQQIWQYYIDGADDPEISSSSLRAGIERKLDSLHNSERFKKWFTYTKLPDYDEAYFKVRRDKYLYDPRPYLKKNNVPMLYLLAGQDSNIPTNLANEYLQKLRDIEKKNIELEVYPNSTHYMFKYGLGDGPWEGILYNDGYLELITDWARKQLK